MTENKKQDLFDIVGKDYYNDWMLLSNHKIYYKNGKPYGVIATTTDDNCTVYIASSTISQQLPFTKSMISDIILMYRQNNIMLITDHKPSQAKIASLLSDRYGFSCEYIDGVLFSYHFKESINN
jgi:hypothetical protein